MEKFLLSGYNWHIMFDNKQKSITDYDLQALIDNELEYEDQKHILDHIEQNPEMKKRYEELKAQKNALQRWYSSKN